MVRAVAHPHDDQERLTSHRSFFHQHAVTSVASALYVWSTAYRQGVAVVAPRVIFASGDVVTPDVCWISRQRLRDRGLDREGNIRQAPELVCEVLSPGRAHVWQDREIKRGLYATQGVQEYWIVDLHTQLVDVHRVESSAWSSHAGQLTVVDQIDRDHALVTPLLPLFSLKVSALFPTLVPRA